MKYHLFRSKSDPTKAITIGEYDNGFYFIPAAQKFLTPQENVFASIEEIELVLDDQLEMIRPKGEQNGN